MKQGKRKKKSRFAGSRINPKGFSSGQVKFYCILLPLSIFMIIPVIYIINQAFKPLGELFAFPPTIIAKNPTLKNFKDLFELSGTTGVPMSRYLLNSLIVTLLTVVLNLVITVTAAYVFSKKKFKGNKALFGLNQLALMFVPTAVAVPRYIVIVKMGMIDTWWAHILPLIAMPVGLFLVKQFVDQIPDALIEAAVMDGANDVTIIFKVIIPLTRPALATSVVLTFQQVWGAVEASNNFITDDSMRTLAFYLNSIATNNTVAAQGMVAAASVILFLPTLIIFICMQSQVMNTMSHSGIK
ncbi:MAG: carbohydrate ABC transporter permease [Lachnospiraceae bacterium]|nr:carbohydrate ABC transporter permease [Lachnospiraceae bacterium]